VNHIQRLTEERDEAYAQMRDALQLIKDLELYLISPKFHDDTTVQCRDVLRHLTEIKSALL
jgi:hypothetical protein